MLARPATTTRRTALGAALGGLSGAAGLGLLTACDPGDLDPRSDPVPSGEQTEPAVDADTALVETVVADIERTLAALPRTRGARDLPDDLVRMHLAHHAALTDAGAGRPPAGTGRPVGRVQAVQRTARLERAHQQVLRDASVAAGSGALATLLAQMSAGVAQRLVVLIESAQ